MPTQHDQFNHPTQLLPRLLQTSATNADCVFASQSLLLLRAASLPQHAIINSKSSATDPMILMVAVLRLLMMRTIEMMMRNAPMILLDGTTPAGPGVQSGPVQPNR